MAIFEADDIAELAEIFDEVGKTISFTQQGTSHYDRATSRTVEDTPEQTYNLKAVVEDMNSPTFNGADVVAGDKKITALAVAFRSPPKSGNFFTLGDHDYTIPEGGIKETFDGEGVVLYEIRASF